MYEGLRDSELEISRTGYYKGKIAYAFHILGRRSTFTSTSVFNDIVEFATSTADIPTISSGTSYEIVSSSANDTSAGTGARTVKIYYLDSSGNITNKTATLNGTTAVSLGSGHSQFLWMENLTTGSGNGFLYENTLATLSTQNKFRYRLKSDIRTIDLNGDESKVLVMCKRPEDNFEFDYTLISDINGGGAPISNKDLYDKLILILG